jgi:hypothetical protein
MIASYKTALTVTRKSHEQQKSERTPGIDIKGKWLRNYGFEVGARVVFTAEQNKLLITKSDN